MKMTKEAEKILKKPLGLLLKGKYPEPYLEFSKLHKNEKVYTVGDIVTKNMLKIGITPEMAVIDGKSMREKIEDVIPHDVVVRNKKSHISKELVKAIREKKYKVILVDGEEDLATLPVVLYVDEGSYVIYGQPQEGIVVIKVDKKSKKMVKRIMEMFEEE